MTYFKYRDKKCYYEERGEGKPLLFLHGNTSSSLMFTGLTDYFEKDYRVVLLDFLGYGRSEPLEELPVDLWYEEGLQTIELVRQKGFEKASLIGSSGGALAAINAALEAPELFDCVIADSFEGKQAVPAFTWDLEKQRKDSKRDEFARCFYQSMLGVDWERVVDQDTRATVRHAREIGAFFHRPLSDLKARILLTGSRADEFSLYPDFFEEVYSQIIEEAGHGQMYLFETGGHPAALSSQEGFARLAMGFLEDGEVEKRNGGSQKTFSTSDGLCE